MDSLGLGGEVERLLQGPFNSIEWIQGFPSGAQRGWGGTFNSIEWIRLVFQPSLHAVQPCTFNSIEWIRLRYAGRLEELDVFQFHWMDSWRSSRARSGAGSTFQFHWMDSWLKKHKEIRFYLTVPFNSIEWILSYSTPPGGHFPPFQFHWMDSISMMGFALRGTISNFQFHWMDSTWWACLLGVLGLLLFQFHWMDSTAWLSYPYPRELQLSIPLNGFVRDILPKTDLGLANAFNSIEWIQILLLGGWVWGCLT